MPGEIKEIHIPLPVQVVIDDVGWWAGSDGSAYNEPFRTGIARDHCPADYEAIAELGRRLGMRPQAAFIACEWDRRNILRDVPTATWMGAEWDNPWKQHPGIEAAAEIILANPEHIEIALHGTGHEFWEDGVMSRAEWHGQGGIMRPRETVLRHLDAYGRILNDVLPGIAPESFVPAAFIHCFGTGEEGLAAILRDYGIRFMSTPFQRMRRVRPPEYRNSGVDAGILTADRGSDLFIWKHIAPDPQAEIGGLVCGMHWPNLLHPDPGRNMEVVLRWVRLLDRLNTRIDRMLAKNTRAWAAQLLAHACLETTFENGILRIARKKPLPLEPPDCCFHVRVRSAIPIQAPGAAAIAPVPGCAVSLYDLALLFPGESGMTEIPLAAGA
jgi:hypothetical protein